MGAIAQSGHAPPGDPFGATGPFSLAAEEVNRELLAAAGFSDVRVEEIESAFRFDDVDGYWNLQSEVAGPVAVLLASLSPDEVDEIRTALEPAVEPFRSNGGLAMPSLAVVVSAQLVERRGPAAVGTLAGTQTREEKAWPHRSRS